MFGRKRHIAEIHSTNPHLRFFAERTATNHPMQGSAADIIKLAMIAVARRLAAEGMAAQMTIQVHDELDFNCPQSELDQLVALVKQEMEGVAELKVPLTATVTFAPNWSAAH
jgi:DNA polymerase-1